eukprot:6426362-Pyramimonas_sp.AAC.1
MASGSSWAVLDCVHVGILPSGLYAHLGPQGLGSRLHAIALVGAGKSSRSIDALWGWPHVHPRSF